jgi:hypothetical protein
MWVCRYRVVNAYDELVTVIAHDPVSENEIVYFVAAASCGYATPDGGPPRPGPVPGGASGLGSGDGGAPNAPSTSEEPEPDVSVPAYLFGSVP